MNFTPEERRKYIGGSDAAAVCGLDDYKSVIQCYLEKIGELEPADLSDNEFVEWGKRLEDPIVKKFYEKRMAENEPVTYFPSDSYNVHPVYPWMISHIDRGGVDHKGIKFVLEVKTANEYVKKQWKDDVPMKYFIQGIHYMIVEDVEYVWLVVLIGGNKYKEYKILRSESAEWMDFVIQKEKDFWYCVENKIMPPVDCSKKKDMDILYPTSEPTQIVVNEEMESVLAERVELKNKIKELEDTLEDIDTKIKAYLQTNESGIGVGYKATYKTQYQERFDSAKFKKEQPELASQYLKQISFRKFDVKQVGTL
jgi:putative phage-type endonuclease